ncbi:MAG: chondroitinase-B domain-containing protein [Myxococcota bacterium]
MTTPITPPANNVGTLTIAGDTMVDAILSADLSDADGTSMSTIAYQWSADGTAIAGAAEATFSLTQAQVGASITVTASYMDDAGFTETVTSAAVGPVTGRPNQPGTVSILGAPSLGRTLTATVTDGNGLSTATISYQWTGDGADIDGATEATLDLVEANVGAMISVNVTYTDDDGHTEMLTAPAIGPVSAMVVNVPGMLSLSGDIIVGQPVTASLVDGNNVSGMVTYQWSAGGNMVMGATEASFTPTAAERGLVLSVTASYMDDDGFAEGPLTATAPDIVYSFVVTGEMSLTAAAAGAADGDVIGLASAGAGDDYDTMGPIEFTANMLTIQRTMGSDAVITGPTCISLSGTDGVIDGLVFDRLAWGGADTICDSNGDGAVYLVGQNNILRNAQFLGESAQRGVADEDPFHYVALKGINNLVERNVFMGKDMDKEGAAITMFADTSTTNESHTIQYNLFKDFPGKTGVAAARMSTAYAVQVGRTTGADAQGLGRHTVQYNRFDSIESERRLMRVQSGENMIRGNTVINSVGLIALEDGFGSTVTQNVILSGGEDNDDGGISFAPLGHTITDNYVSNLRTTSSQRSALLVNPDPLSGSGNTAILGTAGLDFTVTVARNSVINARQAIQFEDADCEDLAPILDFDDNFVMNQSSAMSIFMNTNGSERTVVHDADFVGDGCSIAAGSDFDNNHFYSMTLSETGTFDFGGSPGDNVFGAEDGATFMTAANGLIEGSGADAGVGANPAMLFIIEETQVGPGSTWTAP